MDPIYNRQFRARVIVATALICALMSACSPGPRWSDVETENSRHYFQSLEASQKAADLVKKNNPDVPQFGIEEVNKYEQTALREARLVQDSVLDKAHPELKEHFRSEFQRGLESILASYGTDSAEKTGASFDRQIDLQAGGVRLMKQWNDWLTAHRHEIRMPDQVAAAKPN